MKTTIADLKKGERGIITAFHLENIPIKLLEIGCLPGNEIEMVQIAPFKDPIYIRINGTNIAIRKQIAVEIEVNLT